MHTTQHHAYPATANSPLHTFRLRFTDDGLGLAKDVEFEAFDASRALIIAQEEARGRSAELWCDNKRICTIRQVETGSWEITSRARRSA